MGKIVRQGVEYGGSSNSADCIKYNDTKSVKEAIDEIKASSSGNPTASSVTFDNANTGLEATNVQDAVTEVNSNLDKKQLKTLKKCAIITSARHIIMLVSGRRTLIGPHAKIKFNRRCFSWLKKLLRK